MTKLLKLFMAEEFYASNPIIEPIFYWSYDGVYVTLENGDSYEVDANGCVTIKDVRYFLESDEEKLIPFMRI